MAWVIEKWQSFRKEAKKINGEQEEGEVITSLQKHLETSLKDKK